MLKQKKRNMRNFKFDGAVTIHPQASNHVGVWFNTSINFLPLEEITHNHNTHYSPYLDGFQIPEEVFDYLHENGGSIELSVIEREGLVRERYLDIFSEGETVYRMHD